MKRRWLWQRHCRAAAQLNVRQLRANMPDSNVIETAIGYLRASKRYSRPGATAAVLEQFEREYNVLLPTDMRRFYSAVDGMSDEDLLFESLFRLLPIGEVVPVRDCDFLGTKSRPPGAFVFADHFLGACFFAIWLGPAEASTPVFLAEDPPVLAARGFSEFLTKAINNDDSLFRGESAV